MSDFTAINYKEIDLFLKTHFEYEYKEEVFEVKTPTPDYGSINDSITPTDDILQEKIRKTILSSHVVFCFQGRKLRP